MKKTRNPTVKREVQRKQENAYFQNIEDLLLHKTTENHMRDQNNSGLLSNIKEK